MPKQARIPRVFGVFRTRRHPSSHTDTGIPSVFVHACTIKALSIRFENCTLVVMAMSANDAADAARGRALDCTPTAEMRTSLDAEITDEELTALSKEMIVWLEESLQKKNQPMQNWYSLFRAADADGVARCSRAPPPPPPLRRSLRIRLGPLHTSSG